MLTTIVIVLILLAIALVGGLSFVMSRPTKLRPHKPSRGRIAIMRSRRRDNPRGGPLP